jgi:hypothetical protein
MDILGWLWWGLVQALGVVWTIVWFLLGGWVVTLAQLAVIIGGIFAYKYGWQRAPIEIAQRARTVGHFIWAWMRAKDVTPASTTAAPRPRSDGPARVGRQRQIGDVNLSTLLSIMALAGLSIVAFT